MEGDGSSIHVALLVEQTSLCQVSDDHNTTKAFQ